MKTRKQINFTYFVEFGVELNGISAKMLLEKNLMFFFFFRFENKNWQHLTDE